jgi:hypothetical protein
LVRFKRLICELIAAMRRRGGLEGAAMAEVDLGARKRSAFNRAAWKSLNSRVFAAG